MFRCSLTFLPHVGMVSQAHSERTSGSFGEGAEGGKESVKTVNEAEGISTILGMGSSGRLQAEGPRFSY